MSLRKNKINNVIGFFSLLSLALISGSCNKEEDINAGLPENLIFSHLPTQLSEMLEFGPIGSIRVIPKAHGGFMLKTFMQEANIPVYAMSDGIIYNILKDTRTAGPGFAPPEYQGYEYDDFTFNIAVSRTANMWYGHVSRLADEIIMAAPGLNAGRGVENRVRIEITAGQIIGYIGPHPGFDIGMYDLSKELDFANPSRYYKEYRHTQPWTDYLIPALREQIWAINPRTIDPRGGKINHDIGGTLAGNWFLEGTNSLLQWSKQLVIARHEIYADRITIADASPLVDGDGILNDGLEPYIWFIIGNEPLPENITVASGMIKYEVARYWLFFHSPTPTIDGTVAIQLMDEKTLKYEWREGVRAVDVEDFTGNARIYKR
jgi:hypothetical protein